jgi:hypothetical protein
MCEVGVMSLSPLVLVFRRRHVLKLAVGTLVAGLALPASAGEDDVKLYVGAFRFAGGDKEVQARDEAIEDVVSGMSFLVRGIARSRLTAANPIATNATIATSGASLTIAMDSRSFTGPLDGSKTKVKSSSGDDMDMHFEITKQSLTQVFAGDEKGRINTFTLDGSKGLDMLVHVYAKQLPKDLVYRVTYERS